MKARNVLGVVAALIALAAMFGGGWITGRLGIGSVVSPDSLSEVERAFSERMRDVSLVGTFTVAGRGGQPREDRYDIASVEKIGEDLWRFNARMECCGFDGSVVPIPVPLTFVGDTPMIMMTDTSLAGIGTFTVRLFFYGDRYAGTWQNGPVGGLMTGRMEPAGETDPSAGDQSGAPEAEEPPAEPDTP